MSELPYAGPGKVKVKEFVYIDVPIKVDPQKLWSSTFYNIFTNTSPWVHMIVTEDWEDWSTTAEVWSDDPDYDGAQDHLLPGGMYFSFQWPDLPEEYRLASCYKKVFTLQDVLDAYRKLLAKPHYHCGELVTMDTEEWDACVSDYMIQYLMYDEIIYG